jgi:hypothetical protein
MTPVALGEPDLRLGGLRLWVRGRQFPDARDYWDGNWLEVVAVCFYPGARIELTGPYIRTDDLQRFMDACVRLDRELTGEAVLETLEPNLKVVMSGNGRGRIHLVVALTPDHVAQQHSFEDDIDQTDVLAAVSSLRSVLENFPTIGSSD